MQILVNLVNPSAKIVSIMIEHNDLFGVCILMASFIDLECDSYMKMMLC